MKLNLNTQTVTTKENDLQETHSEIEKIQTKISQLQDEKQKSETFISKINAELDVIRDAEAHLAGFNSGSADIIEASRSKAIPGNLELIIDHLNIPEKYETAIAAALGDVIEGIFLGQQDPYREYSGIFGKTENTTDCIGAI